MIESTRLKKNLKESEKKHRGILENMMEGYFEVDLKGTLTFVNDRYCKIFGYSSKEELIGKNHRTFQDEKTAKKLFKIYNQLYKNEIPSPVLIERQNVTPSGETIYYETLADLKYDSEGNKVGFFGLIRDITERTKTEQKLKESEKKYREILENIKEGYFEVDLKGDHTFVNDYFCKILGYSREEILGKSYRLLYEEKTHKETFKIYNQLYKNEILSPYVYERELVFKDGKLHYLEVLIDLQHDSEGNKVGFFGLIRDITERKEAEKKLKESEEKYRLISETAYDLIGVLNKKFKYEYINETAFQQILGYSSKDLLGKSSLKFTHPEDLSRTAKTLFEGFKKGSGATELRFKHKEGHWVWIEARGRTFFDKDGDIKAIVISRDITERKKVELKLQESEKKYREAYDRANFYKDLFAHDINNILQIISSSAEYISFHLGDSEKSKEKDEFRKIIQTQAERGGKLVKNVLTLSKLEEEQEIIQPIKLYDTLKNSIDFIKKTYEYRNLTIQVDSIDKDFIVQANGLLQDVFENILINSIKYNENENIEILVRISIDLLDNVNYIKIEFIDNGIGVPDNRKEIIFKKGKRELKGSKGIGIGLSLVNKILTTFNGKIWVDDKIKGDYNKGSNFIVLLPITV